MRRLLMPINSLPTLNCIDWRRTSGVVAGLLLPLLVMSQTSPGGVLTSASCRVWVDAGDIDGDGDYTDNPALGTSVTSWQDKSGNNNDLTQGTSANRPAYNTVGGRPVVRFDNTGTNAQFLNASSQSMLTAGTMYFVARMLDAGDGANCLWDRSGGGNSSLRYEQWSSTNQLGFTVYGTSDYASSVSSVYGSNVILSYLKTGASNDLTIAVNNASANLAVAAANPGLPLYVLGKNNTVDGLNGNIMEAIVYNTNLNYAQRMIVDNYLSAKWGGISIISDKYAGDTGGNGDYDYELGGVGNEGGGTNNQASSSITGGLQATQATAMGAGEYLMYAHQSNPTNSVNTTDIGGMSAGAARGRWERIWYFDWTHVGGSNETVNLVFDFSDGGMGGSPSGAVSNYKLLYRSGTSGNWTELRNASSIAGDRVTFNGVAWNTAGDGYYTLGSLNTVSSPLPVEMTAIGADACQNNVCVTWTTLTESNTDHFLVQRSVNGTDWETIGSVGSAGESRSEKNYVFTDSDPLPGIAYYRVITVDRDHSLQFSRVVSVIFYRENDLLNLYPNPADNEVHVIFADPSLVASACLLLSSDGKQVVPEAIRETDRGILIDVSGFPRGAYMFVATLPNGTRVQRKLVLRER